MLISVIVVTRNRSNDLRICLDSLLIQDYKDFEVILVDNGSTDDTAEVIQAYSDKRLKSYPSNFNLGVCGGRNRALRKCKGEIIVVLDDDIEIMESSLLSNVADRLRIDKTIGALAFRIVDYKTGKVDRKFFPSRNKNRGKDDEFETTWVIGAGHAFTREALDSVGFYRDFCPYGSEEYDFSLRLLNKGYRIIFYPRATVIHRESPLGRMPKSQKISTSLKHRLKAAALNLPWSNFIIFTILRSAITLYRSNFDVPTVTRAVFSALTSLPTWCARRECLSNETMNRIKGLRGNVYY